MNCPKAWEVRAADGRDGFPLVEPGGERSAVDGEEVRTRKPLEPIRCLI
jgi:hypothetical protein